MARIIGIQGNSQKLDGGAMFGNAPRPLWEKWIRPDSLGRIPLACRSMLMEHNGKRILFETGIGAFFEPSLADRYGVQDPHQHLLLKKLSELNVDNNSINAIVLSHLHFDHAGGLLPSYQDIQTHGWRLQFPNAKIFVSQQAWERALNPHPRDRASFIPELTQLLRESDRLVIIKPDKKEKELPAELSFFTTDGHTPGHMHSVFKGAFKTVVFAGDLIPGTQWVHLPITMGYDRYAELVIDEKSKFYDRALSEDWWIFYTHDVETALSQIHRTDKGKFEAVNTIADDKWIEI